MAALRVASRILGRDSLFGKPRGKNRRSRLLKMSREAEELCVKGRRVVWWGVSPSVMLSLHAVTEEGFKWLAVLYDCTR